MWKQNCLELEDEYTQLQNCAARDEVYTRGLMHSFRNDVRRERKAHTNTKRVTTRKINMERKAHTNTKRVTTRKINNLKKQLESRR